MIQYHIILCIYWKTKNYIHLNKKVNVHKIIFNILLIRKAQHEIWSGSLKQI